jgi:hypothetical protein|tara:strand:- start:566 stop:769 length:204 start_codon:yes stop_codon:yes gene_type:complete
MAITVVNAILYVYQTVLPTTQENVRESKLAEDYVHYAIHMEVAIILVNVYVTQDISMVAVASLINVE